MRKMSTGEMRQEPDLLNNEEDVAFDFYVSEDILQGEDVPFFIVWKGAAVETIQLEFEGFESIKCLYNVKDTDTAQSGLVRRSDLKSEGYLGGVLATQPSNEPYLKASMRASVVLTNGRKLQFGENRTLHTTIVRISSMPGSIELPNPGKESLIGIGLKGSTTVSMEIEQSDGSEIELVLPKDILTAFETFASAVVEGLERLKDDFPDHRDFLKGLLNYQENMSLRQYFDRTMAEFEEVKHEESLMEAIAMVFVSAILDQASVRNSILLPMIEYLEATTADKAFLRSPFLCAQVPAGGALLSFRLVTYDLRMNECGKPLEIETFLESQEETLVPMKEIMAVRRV